MFPSDQSFLNNINHDIPNTSFSAIYYDSNTAPFRSLVVGCADGYIRTFDDSVKSDVVGQTSNAIDSYVCIGPIAMSRLPRREGVLAGVDLTVAGGGSDEFAIAARGAGLTWSFYDGIDPSLGVNPCVIQLAAAETFSQQACKISGKMWLIFPWIVHYSGDCNNFFIQLYFLATYFF